MLRTTMGQLLVNESLPKEMQNYDRVLDKKGMNDMLRELAQKHPEKYAEVSKKLSDVGRTVATEFGGYSFGLEHLKKSKVAAAQNIEMKKKVKHILDMDQVKIGGKMVDVTPQMRKDMIVKTVGGYQQKQIDDIYTEAVKGNNPLAMQVVSGSRGNKMNLASLLGSDMLYADHRNETIPLGVTSSYSQGLKPVEYWAATYGARRGTMATKFATQDAGFLSKQLNQVAHRLMVVGDDDDRDDVMPHRGLPVDTDDGDNEGALLAKDVGPYKRNTVLSPKILKQLKGMGHDRILVRSPLVGGSPDGGVYARDVGVRERGVLPGRGEQVGLTAAQALSEPLSQGQLSAKHSGGVAGQEKAVGGFAYINQLIQVPKKGKGWASHSEHDGTVSSVEPAPAGGNYVWVGDKRHYVPASLDLKVAKGDEIEAGDVLSEGFPNPSIVTQHKGVGEGKRYFVNAFRSAMNDAGMKCNRRNVELLARGLINHVKLTDEMGDHVPDDVVPYSTMEHLYEPRDGHEVVHPDRAAGQYLERPVLHYSIGTKIRPSVRKELAHFGISEIAVHKEPPPFQSEMVRGMYNLKHDPDWMTRMYGSGLKDSLTDAVHHGAVSDELGTSFVPGLSRAVEFGRKGSVQQPEKGAPLPPEGQPLGDPRRGPATPVKPVSPAISLPTPKKEEPKKTGFFSGMFKLSEEELIKEAAVKLSKPIHAVRQAVQVKQTSVKAKQIAKMRMTKQADGPPKPTVDSTVKPMGGSSTAAPPTTTAGAGAPPPNPSIMPAGPPPGPGGIPNPSIMPGGAPGGAPPAPPPPKPGPPPSPPGVVNPARIPIPQGATNNAWAGGVGGDYSPQAGQGQNPDAFREGYTSGDGLLSQTDSPEMAAQFVQGGGDPNNPSGGFGGQFGAVTRFGSLMDNKAVAALTGQSAYVKNPIEHGGYHDNLIGGTPPRAPAGGAPQPDWLNTIMQDKTPVPAAGAPGAPATPNPAPFTPGNVPKQISPLAPMGVGTGPAPTQGFQNPNFLSDEMAKINGWKAGHPEFDALKAKLPQGTTDSDIAKYLVNLNKRAHLFEKGGYAPGKPKFEAQRKKMHAEALAAIGDVDKSIVTLEGHLKDWMANEPNAPQVAEINENLARLRAFKEKGIPDEDVYTHILGNTDPEDNISDYEMMKEMRGDNGTWSARGPLLKPFISPVTGPAAFKATGMVLKPAAKGLYHVLTHTPLVNKLPGFKPKVPLPGAVPPAVPGAPGAAKAVVKEGEKVVLKEGEKYAVKEGEKLVAKQILKEGEELAAKKAAESLAKRGFKAVVKKIPGVGWVIEGYDASTYSADELRAKFNDKLSGPATAGNIGMYFLDNALNPGANIRAAGIVLGDAKDLYRQTQDQDKKGDANAIANKMVLVEYLEDTAKRRPLTGDEQARLEKMKGEVDAIKGNYKSGWADRKWSGTFGLPTNQAQFDKLIDERRMEALTNYGKARLQTGESSMDAVLAGKATPYETDTYNEWLDNMKAGHGQAYYPQGGPDSGTGDYTSFMGDGRSVLEVKSYTDQYHQVMDYMYQQYVDKATKLGEAGRKDEAALMMQMADRYMPNRGFREQKVADAIAEKRKEALKLNPLNEKHRPLFDPAMPEGQAKPGGAAPSKMKGGSLFGDTAYWKDFADGKEDDELIVYSDGTVLNNRTRQILTKRDVENKRYPFGKPQTPALPGLGGFGSTPGGGSLFPTTPSDNPNGTYIIPSGGGTTPGGFGGFTTPGGFGGTTPGGFGGNNPLFPPLGGGLVRPGTGGFDWSKMPRGKDDDIPNSW